MQFSNLFETRLAVLGVALLGLVCGCAKNDSGLPVSRKEVQAEPAISQSFSLHRDLVNGRPTIALKKAGLDKEFLLQGAVIPQPIAAMGQGIKSRVVAFKRQGTFLYLLEATQGHTVTRELPQTLILAAFPVLSESNEDITIDFNEGMSRIFTADDWRASDLSGADYKPEFNTVKVRLSFLDSAELSENSLVIRQIAQIEKSAASQEEDNSTVEIKYYLSPYSPDLSYKPAPAFGFRKAGYFEVAPSLGTDGKTTVRSSRFNSAAPIVFAISANTPEDFKASIRDGILYWNKVLPQPVIQVVDAPKNVTAPDYRYNLIQWVSWDLATSAYADAQMDPRTGQVLHAQVFLPSVFAVTDRAAARRVFQRLKSDKRFSRGMALSGFAKEPLCDMQAEEGMSGLSQAAATAPDDKALLRATQDYLRYIVAHEVGHTLGMRHNFAGTLGNQNYPLAKRSEVFKEYLTTGRIPSDVRPSSSVMDYLVYEEGVAVGNLVGRLDRALAYDEKALAILYGVRGIDSLPPFCTDSHVKKYVDCQRFDAGSSPMEFTAYDPKHEVENLPFDILDAYINAKVPITGKLPMEAEEVPFNPDAIANRILASRANLLKSFSGDVGFLLVQRTFPFVSSLNLETVHEKELDYFSAEIEKLGGFEAVFSATTVKEMQSAWQRFDKIMGMGEGFMFGVGPQGQKYEFTTEDRKAMKRTVHDLFTKLPIALAKVDEETWGRTPRTWKIPGTALGDKLSALMAKRLDEYVFTATGDYIEADIEIPMTEAEKLLAEKSQKLLEAHEALDTLLEKEKEPFIANAEDLKARVNRRHVKLPKFYYDATARSQGPGLLASGVGEGAEWGSQEKQTAKEKFSSLMDRSLGYPIDKIRVTEIKVAPASLRLPVIRWILENQKVKSSFTNSVPASPSFSSLKSLLGG